MPSRRRFLGLAAASVASLTGCLTAPTGGEAVVSPRIKPLEMGEHARATAAPIETERAVDAPDTTYIPENDTIRYPATMSGGEIASYGELSFEEWAEDEGAIAGTRAIRDYYDEHGPERRFGRSGIGNHGDLPPHIGVSHTTVFDEDGEVVYEPPVSARGLANQTPRSVTATIHFAGKTATNTTPVYVHKPWWDCGAPMDVDCPETSK